MSGKKRRTRAKEDQRGVEERILDAALAILRESGVQQLTQVNVADRAGVRQSHLTYYFPTRRDLLRAVVARGVDGAPYEARWSTEIETPPGELLDHVARAVVDVEHMRLFVAMIVESDGDPALRDLIVDATHRFETALAEALGGDDARERARRVLIAFWGLGLYEFALRPPAKSNLRRTYIDWLGAATIRSTKVTRRRPKQ
jgi:AcrR family transcriptional regulator